MITFPFFCSSLAVCCAFAVEVKSRRTTGCTKKSTGCLHCYAEVMARRLKAMGQEKYTNGFTVTLHERCLNEPLNWKGNHNIFVCSMSDIFHENVPFEFVDKMFNVIKQTQYSVP